MIRYRDIFGMQVSILYSIQSDKCNISISGKILVWVRKTCILSCNIFRLIQKLLWIFNPIRTSVCRQSNKIEMIIFCRREKILESSHSFVFRWPSRGSKMDQGQIKWNWCQWCNKRTTPKENENKIKVEMFMVSGLLYISFQCYIVAPLCWKWGYMSRDGIQFWLVDY